MQYNEIIFYTDVKYTKIIFLDIKSYLSVLSFFPHFQFYFKTIKFQKYVTMYLWFLLLHWRDTFTLLDFLLKIYFNTFRREITS